MLIYAEYSCLKKSLPIFHIAGWSVANTNEELCRGFLKKKSNSLRILTMNTLVHSNLVFQSFTSPTHLWFYSEKVNLFFLYQIYNHSILKSLLHESRLFIHSQVHIQRRQNKTDNMQHNIYTMQQGPGHWNYMFSTQ